MNIIIEKHYESKIKVVRDADAPVIKFFNRLGEYVGRGLTVALLSKGEDESFMVCCSKNF